MGVILFIMVTGTLPYLGEAKIKDPLYQYIKAKNPTDFWLTWKKLFKQRSEERDQDTSLEAHFTSDEGEQQMNEFEPAEKTLCFKVWIEFLYKIGHISQVVIWTLSYLILPILFGLYYVILGICAIPKYVSETQIYCALSGKNYKKTPFNYYLDYKSVIQHKSDDFSEDFKDLVFKMLSYNMLERPSLEQIKEHKWLQGPTPN